MMDAVRAVQVKDAENVCNAIYLRDVIAKPEEEGHDD